MSRSYSEDEVANPSPNIHINTVVERRKAQNAHGCGVVEVALENGQWRVVRPSKSEGLPTGAACAYTADMPRMSYTE